MKDILTPEQRKTVEAIRAMVVSPLGLTPRTQSESTLALRKERAQQRELLSILDSIKAKSGEQLTWQ